MQTQRSSALILGLSILLGLASLGFLLGNALLDFKEYERSVTVKGLSEREFTADVVIWPVQFTAAGNDLTGLYATMDEYATRIRDFLQAAGINPSEISTAAPTVVDKLAQQYGDQRSEFRYTGSQTVTVYSQNIDAVRQVMSDVAQLGKTGIVFTNYDYNAQTEYLFTRLNEVKPEMIEEATRKAREVAEKFASDSNSQLGKIKRASQGQFSITSRDRNNPHIKKVRVVSTVVYYLSD
ncbi:MAG: SIMPL domain-containing protein [Pseudomonadota bacterium]